MPTAISGSTRIALKESQMFLIIMITRMAMIVRMFGISFVTPSFSTSFNELTSPMMRARIFPAGRVSKKLKLKVWICV